MNPADLQLPMWVIVFLPFIITHYYPPTHESGRLCKMSLLQSSCEF